MSENMNVGRITQLTEKLDVDAYARQVVGLIDGCIKGMQRERDEALDALAASKKRVAELEAALKPFAEIGMVFGQQFQRSISYSRTEGLAPRNGVAVLWVLGDDVVTMSKTELKETQAYISLDEIMAAAAALQREEGK